MTKVDKVPDMKVRIINLLHDNLEELIQNPYGNYAVQHALDVRVSFIEQSLTKS